MLEKGWGEESKRGGGVWVQRGGEWRGTIFDTSAGVSVVHVLGAERGYCDRVFPEELSVVLLLFPPSFLSGCGCLDSGCVVGTSAAKRGDKLPLVVYWERGEKGVQESRCPSQSDTSSRGKRWSQGLLWSRGVLRHFIEGKTGLASLVHVLFLVSAIPPTAYCPRRDVLTPWGPVFVAPQLRPSVSP